MIKAIDPQKPVPSPEEVQAFFSAARNYGHAVMQPYIDRYGINIIDARDGSGNTALMIIVSCHTVADTVNFLLRAGASLDLVNNHGATVHLLAEVCGVAPILLAVEDEIARRDFFAREDARLKAEAEENDRMEKENSLRLRARQSHQCRIGKMLNLRGRGIKL